MNARRLGFLVLLLALASSAWAAAPPGMPNGWSDGFVYANGIRIHYYHAVRAPGRPVIVMVHGGNRYRPVLDHTARGVAEILRHLHAGHARARSLGPLH